MIVLGRPVAINDSAVAGLLAAYDPAYLPTGATALGAIDADTVDHATTVDNATNATNADNATLLDGQTAQQVSFPSTIPVGVTVAGPFGTDQHSSNGEGDVGAVIDFGGALAVAPTSKIFVSTGGTDPTCTGTVAAPTAPPGTLCLYEAGQANLSFNDFYAPLFGFDVRGAVAFFDIGIAGDVYTVGTWAVTVGSSSRAADPTSSAK